MPKITDPAILAQLNGGSSPQPVQIAPPSPKLPLEVQGAQLGNQRAAQQIQADRQLLPLQVAKARADLAKTQAEAREKSGLEPQKMANIRAAQGQIDRMSELFMQGPG